MEDVLDRKRPTHCLRIEGEEGIPRKAMGYGPWPPLTTFYLFSSALQYIQVSREGQFNRKSSSQFIFIYGSVHTHADSDHALWSDNATLSCKGLLWKVSHTVMS